MTNETLPCDLFDSLTSVILAVGASEINVTAQIQSCPELCSLAWGNGNPDFSGVGANLSWTLQASLTILLGPLLLICLWFESLYPPSSDEPKIEAVYKDFVAALALVTFPTMFASLIYLRKVVFLFEVTYLYNLNAMQFLSFFSIALSGFLFYSWDHKYKPNKGGQEESEIKGQRFQRNWMAGIGCLFALLFYISVTLFISKSRLSFPFLPDLKAACQDYGNIIPIMPKHIEVPPANIGWFVKIIQWFLGDHDKLSYTFIDYLKVCLFVILDLIFAVCIGLPLLLACYCAMRLICEALLNAIGRPEETRKIVTETFTELHPIAFGVLSLSFSIGMLYCLAQMQFDRNSMKAILGQDYVDTQWGFGQIISLFLWTQVLWGIGQWGFHSAKRVKLEDLRRASSRFLRKGKEELGEAEEGISMEDRPNHSQHASKDLE